MKTLKACIAAAAMVAMAGTAQATLVSLGDGTVKDSSTNLIWLENWNVNGLATWTAQKAWADGYDFAGSSDWRLPTLSEYQALFASYGPLTEVMAFTNVQAGDYWSGTDYAPDPSYARGFHVSFGRGFVGPKSGEDATLHYAVVVRAADASNDGNTEVPEPQTLALTLLALGAAAVARNRRSA